MAATPLIVSLWRDRDTQGFLCSGLLLGPRHILTVRHAFQNFRNDQPVFVRLIDGVEGDVEARVLQRHRERDAAIVELVTAVEVAAQPRLQRTSDMSFEGHEVTLRVIDPDTHNRATASNYSVAGFDHLTGEHVVSPENALGHSGGIVEVDGQVIGLFSRRKSDDPLCRAVAMHLLWPWIRDTLGKVAGDPTASSSAPVGISVSPAYRTLVQRVGERVRQCLQRPGTELLVRHWREDPLASFHDSDPSGQLKSLLYDLHKATRSSIPEWRRRSGPDPDEIKSDCRRLASELVKLAVDPAGDGSERDLWGVAASAPERLHLACQFAGTADVVYFTLGDLETLLERRSKEADIASAQAVHRTTSFRPAPARISVRPCCASSGPASWASSCPDVSSRSRKHCSWSAFISTLNATVSATC